MVGLDEREKKRELHRTEKVHHGPKKNRKRKGGGKKSWKNLEKGMQEKGSTPCT